MYSTFYKRVIQLEKSCFKKYIESTKAMCSLRILRTKKKEKQESICPLTISSICGVLNICTLRSDFSWTMKCTWRIVLYLSHNMWMPLHTSVAYLIGRCKVALFMPHEARFVELTLGVVLVVMECKWCQL